MLIERLDAHAVVKNYQVEFREHTEIVLVVADLPCPHLIDQANGQSTFRSPVTSSMNSKKIGRIAADSQKEIVFAFNRSPLDPRIQPERRMVANLLRNFLTSGVRVQRWRQHVNIIDLRDDIFEFDVGTDERLIAGEITLRKDQW